jgi:hypothetical protein
MDSTIVRVVRLLLPLHMQAQALSWVHSANLEVAMWTSCSVVQACLVRGRTRFPPRCLDGGPFAFAHTHTSRMRVTHATTVSDHVPPVASAATNSY